MVFDGLDASPRRTSRSWAAQVKYWSNSLRLTWSAAAMRWR
ncbi:hypothetical protein [Streptomyces thioluteus]